MATSMGYDVFISYSSKDEALVRTSLLPLMQRHELTPYVAFTPRSDQFLLSLEIRAAMARSRWVLAVATKAYQSSVFTFLESRTALHDGVLIIGDWGGASSLPSASLAEVVTMGVPGANDKLIELLRRRVPESTGQARARHAEQMSRQYLAAERRFRKPWQSYKAAIAAGQLETAFLTLRKSLFVHLHYKYGDYTANADLLGSFATASRGALSDNAPSGPRYARLLTGSTVMMSANDPMEIPDGWIATARGITFRATWNIQRAAEAFELARQIYEQAGDTNGIVLNLINLADTEWESGRTSACCERLDAALDLLKGGRSSELRTVVHQDLLLRLTYAGQLERAVKHKALALKHARLITKRHAIVQANCARQSLLLCRNERAENASVHRFARSRFAAQARKHAESCAALNGRDRVRRNTVRASWLLGAASLALGDHERARKELHHALRRCRNIALVEFEADILLSLARCEMETGNYLLASRFATEARELAGATKRRTQECEAYVALLAIAIGVGDPVAAGDFAVRATSAATEPGGRGHVIALREISALKAFAQRAMDPH